MKIRSAWMEGAHSSESPAPAPHRTSAGVTPRQKKKRTKLSGQLYKTAKTARSPIHSHLDSATPDWPAEEDTTSFIYWTRPSPTRPAPESSEERSRRSALQTELNSENLRASAILSVSCMQFFADWRYVALQATTYSTPHRLVSLLLALCCAVYLVRVRSR
ncbi:hypothetical protein AVEN_200652-1 [Araneus ventricosus]|uniref:Uncharacterized protein n=1 Tax=Araneus ventricosus TaxID=182803 RepID=A0A4Y2L6C6_ARAVE|nr:hypothetical protein AVEN_200652-1 [Araneus ventricosus]